MSAEAVVTVIMPVFNGSRFLQAAVASIAAQAQDRVRAILVDDGSTDDSPSVIKAMAAAHHWIVPVFHGSNRGVAVARNAGLARADTPYIAFLDQDDCWADGKLDRQIAALAADPAMDFVIARQSFHMQPGIERPAWVKDRMFAAPQPGYVFGTMLAHRRCFDRTGPLRENLRYGTDDVDWFARANAAGLRYRIMDDVLLLRTVHAANLSRLTAHSNPELLQVVRDVIRRHRDGGGRGPAA